MHEHNVALLPGWTIEKVLCTASTNEANHLTGGSAAAAGSLVQKLGGSLLGYVFILELDFLKGREKLEAPVYTLLSSQENK